MNKHPFDFLALIGAVIAIGAGVAFLAGLDLGLQVAVIGPVIIGVLGLWIIVAGVRKDRRRRASLPIE